MKSGAVRWLAKCQVFRNISLKQAGRERHVTPEMGVRRLTRAQT
jgi:hypothetical protein